jgi:hypothetical protein
LVDEGDFFVRKEWSDIRDTTEGYAAKSNPIIVLVSTPNKPGGMFHKQRKMFFHVWHSNVKKEYP